MSRISDIKVDGVLVGISIAGQNKVHKSLLNYII